MQGNKTSSALKTTDFTPFMPSKLRREQKEDALEVEESLAGCGCRLREGDMLTGVVMA